MAEVHRDELVRQLRALGVEDGDVLIVHVSLRRVGPIEGRAEALVAALDEAVGPDGAYLVVLGARDDHAWVNERPEAERAALLADAEPFDALVTPAEEDVGAFVEVVRTTPGTVVSDHPEGRFGGRGGAATALLADVPWDDYYGPGSPLDRLVARRGKVLRLGADPDTVTLLHLAEALTPVEPKRRVRRHRLIRTPGGGAEVRVVETLDDSDGIAEVPGEDYFARILHAYLAEGRGRRGLVGQAPSELLDAADLVAFGVDWMAAHLPAERTDA